MRRSAFALALLTLAACTSPTAVDGPWSVSADASAGNGYCVLSMQAEVVGTLDSFSGSGELHLTKPSGFQVIEAEVTGNRREVRVGGIVLDVDAATDRALSGAWMCDGVAGAWRMERKQRAHVAM